MPPKTAASVKPTTSTNAHGMSTSVTRSSQRAVVPSSSAPRKGTSGVVRRSPAGNNAVAKQSAPAYGDVVESDEVHDEIRALGSEVKTMIAQHLPRHGTSEEQVTWGVRQFGPSKESQRALNKENEAAKLAWERGVYCVWRCTETPKLRGANNDFCCRVGYRHVCFCGHTLAAHKTPARAANAQAATVASTSTKLDASTAGTPSTYARPTEAKGDLGSSHKAAAPVSDRQLAQWKAPCEEAGCGCSDFRYIPNTPLEIGEGWLTRRANFNAAAWSAKCRCGHGHTAHDPSATSYLRCRTCAGCPGFTSAFLCVVCDLPWEAHTTVWESEGARLAAGLPVRADYAPLAHLDWDVRELVLTDATMGGMLEPPARYLALQQRQGTASAAEPRTRSPQRRISGQRDKRVTSSERDRGIEGNPAPVGEANGADPVLDVPYCPACATVYRSATSNFCSKCGQPRPRRQSTLR